MQNIRLISGQQAPHRQLDEWLAKWAPKHGADIAQLVSDESIPPPLLAGTTTSQPGPFSGISGVASAAPGGPDRSLRSISFKRSSSLMSVWIIRSSSSCSSLSSASSSPSCIPWEKTPTTIFQWYLFCCRLRSSNHLNILGSYDEMVTAKTLGFALSCSNCPFPITTCSSFNFPKALLMIRSCKW